MEVVPNNNADSIWIKISKEVSKENNDIFLGTYYVSPYSKKNKELDFFSSLNDEICHFKKKGIPLIQGDLNARTGSDKDFIEPDKSDENFCDVITDEQTSRNSED